MRLAEALSAARKESGLGYEELSLRCGVPVNTLKKIFTGTIPSPGFESVRRIARALSLGLDDLDRMLDGQPPAHFARFAADLAILDEHGLEAVEAIIAVEKKRLKKPPKLPDGIYPGADFHMVPVPILGTVNCTGRPLISGEKEREKEGNPVP